MTDKLKFDGKVIVITGAGAGLGKDYALYFGSRGAKVLVNDLGTSSSGEGNNHKSADVVVNEIKKNGGEAIANYDSVEFGEKIIKQAVDTYGRIDVLINNAGILRDKAFKNLEKNDWDLIVKVHLDGAYSCCKAAWPYMVKQKYGRIINVSSPSGLYGSFGQANYSMAKAGLIGFSKTLAMEGGKYNILTNVIAPIAATRMTENLMAKELLDLMKVEYITPVVAYLVHESCEENGSVYEVAGSWVSKIRVQRSEGVFFGPGFSAEKLKENISKVNDFSKTNSYFDEDESSLGIVVNNYEKFKEKKTSNKPKF